MQIRQIVGEGVIERERGKHSPGRFFFFRFYIILNSNCT